MFVVMLWIAAGSIANDSEDRRADAYRLVAESLAPSVVRIETAGGLERVNGVVAGIGPTTGLVVSPDGWIVSSAFALARRPAGILVELQDGTRLPARLVGTDHSRMVSLLKVEAADLVVPLIVPKAEVRPGQTAIALGRTWSAGPPGLAVGIVSATNRVWGKAIQTDAKVSPGNYGGPLVDLRGRVFGVLVPLDPGGRSPTAGFEWYDSGIGFAVPFEDILASLPKLKQGDLFPGLAGIQFKRTSPFNQPVVERVSWRSPAAGAGIQADDAIVRADDRSVGRLADLRQVLGNKYAGENVRLVIRRKDASVDLTLGLVAQLPKYVRPLLGMFGEASDAGFKVTATIPNLPAQKSDIAAGDVITQLNGKTVRSRADLRMPLDQLAPKETALLTIQKDGRTRELRVDVAAFPEAIPELPPLADKPDSSRDAKLEDRRIGGAKVKIYAPKSSLHPGLILYFGGEKAPAADVIAAAWKDSCDRYKIVLAVIEPKADGAWRPPDFTLAATILKEAVKEFHADPERVVLHGAGGSAPAAAAVAQANRQLVRGVILVGAATVAASPTDPAEKQAFAWFYDARDARRPQIEAFRRALHDAGYPVAGGDVKLSDRQYLTKEAVERLARWNLLLSAF